MQWVQSCFFILLPPAMAGAASTMAVMANKKAFLIFLELNEVKNKNTLVWKIRPDSAASSRKHDSDIHSQHAKRHTHTRRSPIPHVPRTPAKPSHNKADNLNSNQPRRYSLSKVSGNAPSSRPASPDDNNPPHPRTYNSPRPSNTSPLSTAPPQTPPDTAKHKGII